MLDFRLELFPARERRALALGATALLVVVVSAGAWLRPAIARSSAPPAPSPLVVLAAQFDSPRSGWIALRSGLGPLAPAGIYRTRDGGQTWAPLPVPVKTPSAAGLQFLDARHGFLLMVRDESAGRASLYTTDDGGDSWIARRLPAAQAGEETVFFSDPAHGFEVFHPAGVPDARVFRTADGGASWTPATLRGLPAGVVVQGPVFIDAARGFAVVDAVSGLRIYRTLDGGESWTLAATPLDGFAAVPQSIQVLAFGNSVLLPVGSALIVSRDGGRTFPDYHPLPAGAGVEGRVACLDALHCRAAYDRVFASSEDGGASWRTLAPRLPGQLQLAGQVMPVDPLTAWAVAIGGEGQKLVRTADGGVSWTEVRLPRV